MSRYARPVALLALALSAAPGIFCQTAGPSALPAYTVEPGTRIPLGVIKSISTKNSAPGERIYLETVFPIVVNSRIVIPQGSFVTGTITEVKKPGRIKGKGELFVRFDSISLPNGVTRDFNSRIGSVDARGNEHLDSEGVIKSDSNKGGDLKTVATSAGAGVSVGSIAGSIAGHPAMGAGIGAAAGTLAGLAGVLMTRGPDAELAKGSTVEMVLDRPLIFELGDLDFSGAPAGGHYSDGPGPQQKTSSSSTPARRIPF